MRQQCILFETSFVANVWSSTSQKLPFTLSFFAANNGCHGLLMQLFCFVYNNERQAVCPDSFQLTGRSIVASAFDCFQSGLIMFVCLFCLDFRWLAKSDLYLSLTSRPSLYLTSSLSTPNLRISQHYSSGTSS